MKTGRMPRHTLPPAVITQDSEPLHQHRRLALLRRVLKDDSLPLRARVTAALVLLYAQPVSRIVRLTTDDEITVTVRLGDPPSPLPEPVADLMRAYIQSRQHLPYASSRSSQWLFPGRQPGQPMNPVSLQVRCSVRNRWAAVLRVTCRCRPVNERPSKWSSPRGACNSR
jgi:hypothetical protein